MDELFVRLDIRAKPVTGVYADRRALKKFAMLDAVNNKQQTRSANSDGVNGEFLLNTQLVNMHYKMPLVGPIESWREADK